MTLGITRDATSGAIQSNVAAAGAKHYGVTGSTTATSGAVNKTGYLERDQRARARKRGIAQRLQVGTSPAGLPPQKRIL